VKADTTQPMIFSETFGGGWRSAVDPDEGLTSVPFARRSLTSQAGARHIERQARGLRELLIEALHEAGLGGLTIQEAAEELTDRRGWLVNEITICGRLAELRNQLRVCDSGKRRRGNVGVMNVVWVLTHLANPEALP